MPQNNKPFLQIVKKLSHTRLRVPQDNAEAIKWWRVAAKNGNASAQSRLGDMYTYGDGGVQADMVEASKWYRMAADQGDEHAISSLADMYKDGKGVPKDIDEATKWYRKAAEQRNPCYAMLMLGQMAKDVDEMRHWYKLAADRGDARAKPELAAALQKFGRNHRDGSNGKAKDALLAAQSFREAAELGNAGAQVDLGCIYYSGQGMAKDYSEAFKWFKKAADQGNALGQSNLGLMYKQGLSVQQDIVEAARLFKLAADQGNDFGKKELALAEQALKQEVLKQEALEQARAKGLTLFSYSVWDLCKPPNEITGTIASSSRNKVVSDLTKKGYFIKELKEER